MYQERKDYRKNFSSSGKLHIAGEVLDFISHDVSVKGIMIEVVPGRLLAEYEDFEAHIKENTAVEIFVKNLMLTGDAEVIWLRNENGKIMMGLVFHDVIYNADRLWIKRQFYRKEQLFKGTLTVKDKNIDFEGRNVSVDGLMIYIEENDDRLKPDVVVKLSSEALKIKAAGKICWIKEENDSKGYYLGLRYLSVG